MAKSKKIDRENRRNDAVELLKQASGIINDLKEECLESFGSLPENFQQSERGELLETAATTLEEVETGIDDQIAALEEVEF